MKSLLSFLFLLLNFYCLDLKSNPDTTKFNEYVVGFKFSENLYLGHDGINSYSNGSNITAGPLYSGHIDYSFVNTPGCIFEISKKVMFFSNSKVFIGLLYDFNSEASVHNNSSYLNNNGSSLNRVISTNNFLGLSSLVSTRFKMLDFLYGFRFNLRGFTSIKYFFNDNSSQTIFNGYDFGKLYFNAGISISRGICHLIYPKIDVDFDPAYFFNNSGYCARFNVGFIVHFPGR